MTARKVLNIERVGLVITDWDDTATVGDTMELCFKAVENSRYGHSHFLELYLANRALFMKHLADKPYKKRETLEDELAFQRDIKRVEESSALEAVRVSFFKGLKETKLRAQAHSVTLRSGFVECLKKLTSKSIPVEIVSVNWTGKTIDEALRLHGFEPERDGISITSNELEFVNDVCTGEIYRGNPLTKDGLRTGSDKLAVVKRLLEQHKSDKETVYVGDSSTDVLAMTIVDKAIVIKGGSASEVLSALGYAVTDGDSHATGSNYVAVSDWRNLL